MVTLQKSGDSAVKFVFTDSDHYLYGNGEVVVPVNSLSLVIDESEMVTFKKAATADPFISFRADNSNLGTKEAIEQFYKENMVGSTGGDGSGVTPSEVQEMIDNSLVDYYTDDEVDAALSGKQDTLRYYTEDSDGLAQVSVGSGQKIGYLEVYNDYVHLGIDGQELAISNTGLTVNGNVVATQPYVSASVSGKADTTAVTAVNNALTAHTSDTGIHVTSQEKDTWNSKVDVNQLNEAVSGKADTSAVTAVENEITVLGNALAGKANTAALTAHTSDTGIHVSTQEKNAWNAKAEPYSAGTGIEISGNVISATGGGGATYSAGYGINIDTANTISFNMPITCTTNTNDNITIGNGTNNGYWSLLVGNDMSITNSTGSIGLCVSDMSIGGSSISGNTRGVLIGCQNTIKGGDISVGGGVAIGDRNQSTDGGIVIGTNSKASGSSTVAIGLSANATGTTKMNLNNQIKVDTNNQIYIKDKTNTTEICLQDALSGGGGGSVTVDSELDMNSSNPVENQAIAAPIEDIYNALDGSYNDGTQMVKLKRISKSDYDDLVNMGTIDYDTLYIITPDEPAEENEGGE